METADRKAMRLGPIAMRVLGRRRQWIRWLAVALAGVTAASAFSHSWHTGTARPAQVPVVIVRHAMRAGQPIRPADVEVVSRNARPGQPPFSRAEDAVGHVAVRGLRVGEDVTPDNAVPLLRYYGVAARVPYGMRAINLVVPSAATFGGELAPLSRVDLLGAFELGQERAAATLLTSGIVLRVVPSREALPPSGGRLETASPGETGRQGPPVEVEVAVPEGREREIALAQAFGRIFLAVHSLAAEAPHPEASGVVNLRRYLNLPPASSIAAPFSVSQGWPAAPSPGAGPAGHNGYPYPPARPYGAVAAPPDSVARTPLWTVEVIEGAARSIQRVPRVGDH